MYKTLEVTECTIIRIDDDAVVVEAVIDGEEVHIGFPKKTWEPGFARILEVGAILTWRIYEYNGVAGSGFRVRFPRLKGT